MQSKIFLAYYLLHIWKTFESVDSSQKTMLG